MSARRRSCDLLHVRSLIALASSLLCLGCSGPERHGAFTLHVAVAGDLAPFHPSATSSFTTAATELAYQRILRVGRSGELQPWGVRSWRRLAADRILLTIDPGLRFSDGSPVSTADLIHSLSAVGLAARAGGGGVEVEQGSSPDPLEIKLLYAAVFKEATPAPLGTGPFRLVEADARHILLERIDPEPGRIARVEIESVPTPRDAFAKALRGEANAVMTLDERQSELMEGVPTFRVLRSGGPHALAVVMNVARLSRSERLALARSIPLGELARAYGGSCSPFGDAPLAESPPNGGVRRVATATHDPGLPRMALALRRALGTSGGDLALEEVSRSRSRVAARDFDLLVSTVVAWPQVMLGWSTRTGAGANFTGYSNPRVDAAIDRGDMPAVLDELQRDPPLVLVCRRERIAAVDSRLKNATLGSWGLLETLPQWEVSP